MFAFVKGAHIKLLELSSGSEEASRVKFSLKSETVKGALVMLSANVVWSMWYIMQVCMYVCTYISSLSICSLQARPEVVELFVRRAGTCTETVSGKGTPHNSAVFVQLHPIFSLGHGNRKGHFIMEASMGY